MFNFVNRITGMLPYSTRNPNYYKEEEEEEEQVVLEHIEIEPNLVDPKDRKKDTLHQLDDYVFFLVSGNINFINEYGVYGRRVYYVKDDDGIIYHFHGNQLMTKNEYKNKFLKKVKFQEEKEEKERVLPPERTVNWLHQEFIEEGLVDPTDTKDDTQHNLHDDVYFVQSGQVNYIGDDETNKNRKIYEVILDDGDFKYFYGNQLMTEDEYNNKFSNKKKGIMTKRNAGSRRKIKRRRVKSTRGRNKRHNKSTRRRRRKY